jgi:hypothetical protein
MTSAYPSPDGLHDDLDIDSGVSAVAGKSLGLINVAQSRLLDLAEDGKSELVRSFDGLVTLAHELAAQVDSAGGGAVATYAYKAAGLLSDIQAELRDKPVEDLLDEGRTLIRQSPGLAVGVAFLAGLIAARLFKASSR